MDLWIRNQERTNLIKANDIFVCNQVIYIFKEENRVLVAEYKTKERALEVLDEIQKLLMPTYLISNISFNEGKKLQESLSYGTSMIQTCDDSKIESLNGSILYIMPKE